ncbi:hypothetical protein [Rhodococcus rhodnii]|uniref:Integral membrane protein n=1 Tax=Rhodococcus rhodnii LMG 5362 TaxID=1273125 RepID=R7WL06_9NOCA|nr:hypothetical protein [Rhodococcus rhodnii]EOM75982.1 hypothetical protein Rrhod_2630 [Rhodococcus rhodnii LMG 5362]
MAAWFQREIVDHGHVQLFGFFVGFVLTFLFIRLSTRMIRANVRWWPGNITPGGQHIHHAVFGVVIVFAAVVPLLATIESANRVASTALASAIGIGAALILDEFALIFYLRDVYWSEQGRVSVDAVFTAIGITALFLIGVHPLAAIRSAEMAEASGVGLRVGVGVATVVNLALAVIVLLKGKIWTGLVGLFVPPLLVVGAIRVGRPAAPWARWFYRAGDARAARAIEHEKRWRVPVEEARIYLQDLVAGRPDQDRARVEARRRIDRAVTVAPPPISPATGESGTMGRLPGQVRSPHASRAADTSAAASHDLGTNQSSSDDTVGSPLGSSARCEERKDGK